MRVCGYHCPMSHAMRDWEKGSRNLASSGSAPSAGHWDWLGAAHSSEPVSMSEPLMPG